MQAPVAAVGPGARFPPRRPSPFRPSDFGFLPGSGNWDSGFRVDRSSVHPLRRLDIPTELRHRPASTWRSRPISSLLGRCALSCGRGRWTAGNQRPVASFCGTTPRNYWFSPELTRRAKLLHLLRSQPVCPQNCGGPGCFAANYCPWHHICKLSSVNMFSALTFPKAFGVRRETTSLGKMNCQAGFVVRTPPEPAE